MNKQNKSRNDLIFIVSLLAVTVLCGLAVFLLRAEGEYVTVTVDKNVYGTYPLSKDTVIDIRTGDDGTQYNRLVICDGVAFVEEASCPDGICAAHKPILREGESIVCLPHKVIITVESAS